jgi:hypothetical protein
VAAIHVEEAPRRFPALPIMKYDLEQIPCPRESQVLENAQEGFVGRVRMRGDVNAAREGADDKMTYIFCRGRLRTSPIPHPGESRL